ncbi:ribonuclease Z [Ureibacillus xyleni]|uniref:Ribonuclease Z n=1 Tax=Ureibacillus xyleni TaxID=614648 RepID=A0A285RWP1_9BACL|nr:MBL fold metallo-hydrolase [Ureibacillus xyleni]SOB98827.1 ribonuclease Z [Ureibacillus xyleni]
MNFELIMLGTGSPRMNKDRFSAAQVVNTGENLILVDCADGTTMQLARAGINPKEIKHIFLTHLHADHYLGYANFLISGWVEGRRELTLIGPRGTKEMHEQVIGMLKNDINYRMQLGRPINGIYDVKVIEIDESGILDVEIESGLSISTAEMVHNVPTFAYKFEKNNKVLVISGDTAPHQGIIDFSDGADALVLDTCLTFINNDTAENAKVIWENLQKEHCTPEQSAEIASKANVQKLIMTHFLPGMDEENVRERTEGVYKGELFIPNDLDRITI